MSIEDAAAALALLEDERPAYWVQYHDGSWSPVFQDGLVGHAFKISELLEIAKQDIAELEDAGLIGLVIDIEPVSVSDTEIRGPKPAKGGGV